MAVTANSPAPYAPAAAILDIIDRYRNRGLQKPFTPEVLGRAGITDSLIARVLYALRALDLNDEAGNPTETLEELARCPEAEFKPKLAAWIRAAYADVFAFIDAGDSEEAIRDAFRNYNPRGQQPRMVTLFIGLCRAAGLRSDDKESEPRRRIVARRPTTGQFLAAKRQPVRTRTPDPAPIAGAHLPPVLAGLLASLPEQSKGWTKDARSSFLKTFEAVLDFCYPVREPEEEDTSFLE